MPKQEDARKALKDLEDDPKHSTETDETKKQTKNDDMDDPKHNKKDGDMDAKWHEDANGHWHHPDYE